MTAQDDLHKNAFSVREAAEILGVSTTWLNARCAAGEIAHQDYGRVRRFTAAQVDAVRKQYEQPARTDYRHLVPARTGHSRRRAS